MTDSVERDAALARLDAIVRDAAAAQQARVEQRPASCDVATGRTDHGGLDIVTRLGERIRTADLTAAAEVLAYVQPTRPFDPRYVVSPVSVERPLTTTRHRLADELNRAIDGG